MIDGGTGRPASAPLAHPARPLLLVIGLALVAAGLVVSLVPIFNGPSQTLTSSHPTAAFNATATLSLAPDWTVGLSWSSNQRVSLLAVVCRSVNISGSSMESACPGAVYTVLNGTSGSGTFSVPLRGTLLVGIVSTPSHGVRVDVQLKPTLGFEGTVLVIGGVGAAVAAFIPRRRRRLETADTAKPADDPAR
jgi:hypothetical protein